MDQFISGLSLCVCMILSPDFDVYNTFTYSSGYLVLYLLIVRCWGDLCSDLWNVSRVSSKHG